MEQKNIDFTPFFELLNHIKTMHWQTQSHTHHVALDECYETLEDCIDSFVENFIGIYPAVHTEVYDVEMNDIDSLDVYTSFRRAYNKFNEYIAPLAEGNGALSSIKDDMETAANKCCYLLKMN